MDTIALATFSRTKLNVRSGIPTRREKALKSCAFKPEGEFCFLRRQFCLEACIMILVFFSLVSAAGAQAIDVVSDEFDSTLKNFSSIDDAARRSELLFEIDDGVGLTFFDVLADPDNIPLNFRWARTQIARGDVRGAAATLERILAIDPALAAVRLYYAIVLFRLDSLNEAQAQFERLREGELDAEVDRQVADYLNMIRQRRQLVRQGLSLSFGPNIESNKNASPRAEEHLVAGTRQSIANAADLQKRGVGWLGLLRYDLAYDLGHQEGHEVFGSATAYSDDQVSLDSLDVMSLSFEGGIRWRLPNMLLSTTLVHTAQSLSREKFLTARGVELRVDRTATPDTGFWGQVAYFDERYHNVTESSTLSLRAGQRHELEMGISRNWSPTHRSSVVLAASHKEAEVGYFSYRRYVGTLTHVYLLSGGRFVQATASWGKEGYLDFDPLVVAADSPLTRTDRPLRLGATYGAPLSSLLDCDFVHGSGFQSSACDLLAGFSWSITGEWLIRDSTLPNYAYTNKRARFLISRRWEW